MNTKKLLMGTLAGGLCYFLLGWLIYGQLLAAYMAENTNPQAARSMEDMLLWSIAIANLIWGLFLSLVFQWIKLEGTAAGLKYGFILGAVVSLSINFSLYAGTTYFSNMTALFVDAAGTSLISAICGAVIGSLSKPEKSAD